MRLNGRVQLDEGLYQEYLRDLRERAQGVNNYPSNLPAKNLH
jgi:hypothetical protein